MGRRATGRVDERTTASGDVVYSIRVPYRGKRPRVTLGARSEGWTRQQAEQELEETMLLLRRGATLDDIFSDRVDDPVEAARRSEPTLATIAAGYLADREDQVAAKTVAADRWALEGHVLPILGHLTPSEIGIDQVDEMRRRKVRERKKIEALTAAGAPPTEQRSMVRDDRTVTWRQRRRALDDPQINRLIDHLATLLDVAIERPDVALTVNPARGKRRKIRVTQPTSRSYLEPDQVWVLLDAAHELEQAARRSTGARATPRRAILATLVMGGERISELCDTRRRNLNLGARVLRAGGKTAAGTDREIDLIFDVLIDVLSDHLAATDGVGDDFLFAAHGGGRLSPDNVRRALEETVARANELAQTRGITELGRVTPHTLRRTNISLLAAAGYDPAWIIGQIGHTDPKLTLRIYTQVLKRKRSQEYRDRANELLGAATAPRNRPGIVPDPLGGLVAEDARTRERPADAGLSSRSG